MSTMQYVDPRELNDLASLAAKGGLARGVALTDCVAEAPDQLMYIAGDELILLRDLGDILLASCEGVVGWVRKGDVRFEAVASTSGKSSLDLSARDSLPRTILTAPSPPTKPTALPEEPDLSQATRDLKRVSGPFELDSPQQSPAIEREGQQFFVQQKPPEPEAEKRQSVTSVASSEAFGGIGGFMMGDETTEEGHDSFGDGVEDLTDETSPMSASLETPLDSRFLSEPVIASHPYPPGDESIDVSSDLDKDWVMRESMNGGVQHMKVLPTWGKDANQGSSPTKRIPVPSSDIMGTKAMRPREERRGSEDRLSRRPPALDLELGSAPGTPYVPPRCPNPPKAPVGVPSPSLDGTMTGRSVATELRLRIQRERERTSSDSDIHARCSPGSPAEAKRLSRTAYRSETPNDSERSSGHGVAVSKDEINEQLAGNESRAGSGSSDHTEHNSSEGPQESEISTVLETPQPSKEMTFTAPSPPLTHETLLASPLPLDDGFLIDAWKKSMSQPNLIPPPPPTHSPSLSPNVPITAWSPGSPASPHSIAATRQAVEAVRQTSEGKRPRGMTLVGRMEADLRASKGPVPITFLVGDPSTPTPRIGLGLPSTLDRITPEQRRATTPTRADPPMPEDIKTIRDSPSRFPPVPVRSVTSPDIIPQVPVTIPAVPKPGFFPARPRSRSFSATVARTFTKGRKESTPPLSIDTSTVPPVPAFTAPQSSKRSFFSKASPSTPGSPARPLPGRSSTTSSAITQPPPITSSMHSNDSIPSLALPSARSSSFSFSSKSSKPPRNVSRSLANPVSHKDFEETVQADGMDFELVKPTLDAPIDNRLTIVSGSSSGSFRAPLPETDEWGFLKEKSPTPEIFQSRSAPGDHRIAEQKWLSIISSSMPAGGPPKKVRKLVMDVGIPGSLRGKVWAWFMASSMSARVPGLFNQLLDHDKGTYDNRIDADVASEWSDHSIFSEPNSPGRSDLRNLLRAYSNFAPSGYTPPMVQVTGALLVHCVVEDAFWLLSGLVNGVLKNYWVKERTGMRVDAAVFQGLLSGSEKELAGLFKEIGLHPIDFLEGWFTKLFIRSLPWPTALRVIDVLVSEGPRFLLIASLTILTVSRDRILSLPRSRDPVLAYLRDPPQDSLLLPETFMRACERVKFREDDWKKLRGSVERELGLV